MADMFELITYIHAKKYFAELTLERRNLKIHGNLSTPLKISENNDGKQGSTFKIYFTLIFNHL